MEGVGAEGREEDHAEEPDDGLGAQALEQQGVVLEVLMQAALPVQEVQVDGHQHWGRQYSLRQKLMHEITLMMLQLPRR